MVNLVWSLLIGQEGPQSPSSAVLRCSYALWCMDTYRFRWENLPVCVCETVNLLLLPFFLSGKLVHQSWETSERGGEGVKILTHLNLISAWESLSASHMQIEKSPLSYLQMLAGVRDEAHCTFTALRFSCRCTFVVKMCEKVMTGGRGDCVSIFQVLHFSFLFFCHRCIILTECCYEFEIWSDSSRCNSCNESLPPDLLMAAERKRDGRRGGARRRDERE